MNYMHTDILFFNLSCFQVFSLSRYWCCIFIVPSFNCSLVQESDVWVVQCLIVHVFNVSMFRLFKCSTFQFVKFPSFQLEVGGSGGSPANQARQNCTLMPYAIPCDISSIGQLYVLLTYGARICTTCAGSGPYAISPYAHMPGAYDYSGGGIRPTKPGVIAL